ncbi:MAG: hypothetical protein HY904_01690 [Deltaproteobacteria bacterium]|nr:hypothetical protein [Deltaproteobacteria bacterium]
MPMFDFFMALDGYGLNGFEGFGGVARLRADPDADRWDTAVQFFPGFSGGHATQINPAGTLGYLGNLSQTLLFYDPRTLRELTRCSTLRFCAPEVFYQSQTHVVWLGERTFITVLGDDFYRFEMDCLDNPERLGPHGVTLPHAVKLSPSGRYLFYGAMDHDRRGYANQVGVFDLRRGEPRVVRLPATAWHLGVHPTRDVFYAPTQRCTPQGSEFGEYTIAHFKNYLFEVDGETARVTRHMSIPKDLPGALTSDVVVTEDAVLYNACAASVIVRVDLATLSDVTYLDERAGLVESLRHWRTGVSNVVESFSRVHVPGNTHVLLKALRATRWSLLDGSYGLALSPDRRFLLSAHRGLNEVRVYRYPALTLHRRIRFPPIRKFFPRHISVLEDTRLGFHHATLATTTVSA